MTAKRVVIMVNKKAIFNGIVTVVFLYEVSVFALGDRVPEQKPDGNIEATCDICKSGPEAEACIEAVNQAKILKKQICQNEGTESQACKEAVKHLHYCRTVGSPSHVISRALMESTIVEEAEASVEEVPGNSLKAGA